MHVQTLQIGMEQQEADVDFSEIFSMERIAYNMRNINFCRTFVAIVSGIAAGIMGLTGILGFLAFLLTTCLLSVGMYLNVAGDAKPYFKSPNDIWTEGITQAMMSYVLFWTLCVRVSLIPSNVPRVVAQMRATHFRRVLAQLL